MDFSSNWKCWEITGCDKIDCPARAEPETPCWEIAQRIEDYRSISNTCKECIVYLLKKDALAIPPKKLKEILKQRGFSKNIKISCLACALKSNT